MRKLLQPVASHPTRINPWKPNRNSPVWLFDLDNTLHDSSREIFKIIDQSMTAAVAASLNINDEAASELRAKYWKRYGATVIGLVRHHGINPYEFLNLSHSFDIPPLVHAETALSYKLGRLDGRKILLTNAPLQYARTVLATLGILPQFESLWAIDRMLLQGRIRPKPSLALMKQVLARLGTQSSCVTLVDDTLKNLKSAKQLGMRTVYVYHPGTPFSNRRSGRDSYVDLRINSLSELLIGHRALRG
ncbi:MAG: pyrimidine 5'-nucleotidase [Burkholderiaceae bacterium]|nr:MAG: pyrimidine 5'-nucleotidase [Burkholderiaceae bacterium]TAM00753.1 MAG: pyrimidine 5'-nucleotidase [Pusillimonas sp.]